MTRELFFEEGARADLPALETLERRSFQHSWSALDLERELRGSGRLFLVLRSSSGSALAGFACWRCTLDEAELLRVAVDPEHRRQGAARQLLLEGHRRLQQAGVSVCFLEVRSDNGPAQALYRSLGFEKTGERPGYYRDGEAALLYSLRLSPP